MAITETEARAKAEAIRAEALAKATENDASDGNIAHMHNKSAAAVRRLPAPTQPAIVKGRAG